jgi:hypothetical protein
MTSTALLRSALLGIGLYAALAGCGLSDYAAAGGPSAARSPDPCTLLESGDIQRIIGHIVFRLSTSTPMVARVTGQPRTFRQTAAPGQCSPPASPWPCDRVPLSAAGLPRRVAVDRHSELGVAPVRTRAPGRTGDSAGRPRRG